MHYSSCKYNPSYFPPCNGRAENGDLLFWLSKELRKVKTFLFLHYFTVMINLEGYVENRQLLFN